MSPRYAPRRLRPRRLRSLDRDEDDRLSRLDAAAVADGERLLAPLRPWDLVAGVREEASRTSSPSSRSGPCLAMREPGGRGRTDRSQSHPFEHPLRSYAAYRRRSSVNPAPMLLTIRTTHVPATDLGYLLHKHPDAAADVRAAVRHGARLLPGGDATSAAPPRCCSTSTRSGWCAAAGAAARASRSTSTSTTARTSPRRS